MKYLSAPVEVSLEITNKCNLLCTHCYSSSGPFKFPNELTYGEITGLVDELADMKVFRLQLVGGEPFIRDDTPDVIKYTKGKGMAATCSTNGCYLDDRMIRKLKEYGLDNMQISIDGARPETHDKIRAHEGSFQKAVDAAKRAKMMGIPVTIGTTVMSYNWREIPDIANMSIDIGADALHIMGLQPGGRGLTDFYTKAPPEEAWIETVRYFQEKREEFEPRITVTIQGARFALINRDLIKPCEMNQLDALDRIFTNCDCAKSRCVIDSRGNVLPCDNLRFSDANIRTTPFKEAWENSAYLNALRNREVHNISDCEGCSYADSCRGGCPASAYNIFARFEAADPRCMVAKRSDDEHYEHPLQI